jgi:hypothetical protein
MLPLSMYPGDRRDIFGHPRFIIHVGSHGTCWLVRVFPCTYLLSDISQGNEQNEAKK